MNGSRLRNMCRLLVVANSIVLIALLMTSQRQTQSRDPQTHDLSLLDLRHADMDLQIPVWLPRRILSRGNDFRELRREFSDVTNGTDPYDWVTILPSQPASPRKLPSQTFTDCLECFERPAVVAYGKETVEARFNTSASATNGITVFSIESKLGPITAMKDLLQPMGARFTGVNLSPLSETHDADITSSMISYVGKDGTKYLHQTDIWEFWRRYLDDERVVSADAFMCISPASLCELYMPMNGQNRSLIVVIDGRYELGRGNAIHWAAWNMNLRSIASDRRNIVVATNTYDAQYVRQFTDLDLPVMPFLCDYVTERYDPSERSFLLLPTRKQGFEQMILNIVQNTSSTEHLSRANLRLATDIYPEHKARDLVKHRGVVVIPHQVSYLALTELLRTNVPIFFPSIELLARWHADVRVMTERTLRKSTANAKTGGGGSPIPGSGGLPDPNNDTKLWALGFWITFLDVFNISGVNFFSSVEDLARLLHKVTDVELRQSSRKLEIFNNREKDRVRTFWMDAIKRIKQHRK